MTCIGFFFSLLQGSLALWDCEIFTHPREVTRIERFFFFFWISDTWSPLQSTKLIMIIKKKRRLILDFSSILIFISLRISQMDFVLSKSWLLFSFISIWRFCTILLCILSRLHLDVFIKTIKYFQWSLPYSQRQFRQDLLVNYVPPWGPLPLFFHVTEMYL